MNSDRLKVSEKLGFALTNLGNIPIMTLLNTYLLIFYTDVIGVNPALVGMLFLVSRLLDGVSDPLIGFVIDRFPRTTICLFGFRLSYFQLKKSLLLVFLTSF